MASFANWIIIMIIISSCWHKTNTFCSAFVFQHRIIESRPAEYNRPVFLSNWSAFTPDRWRGSCSSLMVKDTVTFLLGIVWLCGWACEWPEQGRTPAAILHFFFCQLLFSFPIRHSRALSIVSSRTSRNAPHKSCQSPAPRRQFVENCHFYYQKVENLQGGASRVTQNLTLGLKNCVQIPPWGKAKD